jgi:hypothetical protein
MFIINGNMPRKHHDETVYMKVDGKMQAIGRIYDRDHIGYGTYFITNTKYGRSMNWVGAAPNPDFIRLETAIELSRDNIKDAFRDIVYEYVDDPSYFKDNYYAVDKIIQAIRKTFLDKKKEMLDDIKS